MFLPTLPVMAASSFMDHEEIRKHVRQYLQNRTTEQGFLDTSIEVGRIDNRLKLAKCDSEPEVIFGNNRLPGNVSLAVRCNTGKPWKIYIQATVNAYKMIYVARAPIARGAIFTSSDLLKEKHNITSLNGNYVTDINSLKGHVAKRNVRKGEIIKPFLAVKSKLIKRGEQVTIIAETGGIKVRMMGKAMNDASAGEQVRVKNNNSKRIIEGTAVNRGIVKINL
jgi:flagella basal body P-ring formation protein FlgA